jgi:hypothetical protein
MVAKIEPEPRACEVCGSVFLVGGTGNRKRASRFCSVECRNAAKYNTNGNRAREMSATDAAYLAGIIDGEGHISIYGGYGGADPHRYRAHLGVANTSMSLLEWCKSATGVGGIAVQRKVSETRKAVWQWMVVSEGAASVLVQVLPYLVIKADRAKLVVEFQSRLRQPALKADRAWQHDVVARVRELNARGPA